LISSNTITYPKEIAYNNTYDLSKIKSYIYYLNHVPLSEIDIQKTSKEHVGDNLGRVITTLVISYPFAPLNLITLFFFQDIYKITVFDKENNIVFMGNYKESKVIKYELKLINRINEIKREMKE
jgi:hypothetical protein